MIQCPLNLRKQVLDAVITSKLLYGCESWLTERTNKIEKLYSGAIKALLGVREMTRTDTVLIETGMTTAKDLIRKKTETFVRKKLVGDVEEETPLFKIYKICEKKRTVIFS